MKIATRSTPIRKFGVASPRNANTSKKENFGSSDNSHPLASHSPPESMKISANTRFALKSRRESLGDTGKTASTKKPVLQACDDHLKEPMPRKRRRHVETIVISDEESSLEVEEETKEVPKKKKSSNRVNESRSESSDTVTSAMDVDSSMEWEEQIEEEVSEEEGSGRGVFGLVEAPVFYPTSKEFADPNTYLEKIRRQVEPFGICRIVPPKEWNKEGWKQHIDPRSFSFATKIQSIHTLQKRDGAYTKFMVKLQYFWTHIALQEVEKMPEIGGLAVDLYCLHTLVASHGGYDAVKEQDLWHEMLVPLHLNPHATSAAITLSNIYRRFLLPFDHYLSSGGSIPEYSTTTQAKKSQGQTESCDVPSSCKRETTREDSSCGKKSSLERGASADGKSSEAKTSPQGGKSRGNLKSSSEDVSCEKKSPLEKKSSAVEKKSPPSRNCASPTRTSSSRSTRASPSTPSPPSPSNILPTNRVTRQSSPGNAPPTSPYRRRNPKRHKYSDDDEDDVLDKATKHDSAMALDETQEDRTEEKASQERHELPIDIATFTESTLQSIDRRESYFGPYGDLEAMLSEKDVGSWRKAKANSFVYDQDDSFVLCWYCRKGDNPGSLVLCDTPDRKSVV